jgi:hypothetical protein
MASRKPIGIQENRRRAYDGVFHQSAAGRGFTLPLTLFIIGCAVFRFWFAHFMKRRGVS